MLDGQNEAGPAAEALERARADLTGAQRRVSVLELFNAAIAGMKAEGLAPDFEVDGGVAMLSVEIEEREPERPAPRAAAQAATAVTAPPKPDAPAAEEERPSDVAKAEPAVTTPAPEAERVTGPFTPAEDETIKKLAAAGKTTGEIAAALNRASQGVGARVRMLSAQESAPKRAPRPVQTTRPARSLRPEDDVSNGMGAGERHARRLVRAAGYPKPWTAEKDLALFEAICAGRKLPYAAEAAKVTTEMAKQRWNALFPASGRSYEAQVEMIHALRKIAAEAAG